MTEEPLTEEPLTREASAGESLVEDSVTRESPAAESLTQESLTGAQVRPAYPASATPGRSANMRAIRRTNTKPEIALRSALHRQGYRFRKDHRLDLESGVRVRPDIAFTGRRVAVFVDGCFWHACPQHGRNPSVNEWYWAPKLRRTVERDRAADAALTAAGWQVVRVWEHVPLEDALALIVTALDPPPPTA